MRNKYEDTLAPARDSGSHVTGGESVPNMSDLSFAQVQFTYAGSQKETRVETVRAGIYICICIYMHTCTYIHVRRTPAAVSASARGCPEGEYCIFYIRSCAKLFRAPVVVNSPTVHVPDFDSIAFPDRERPI